MKKIVFFLTIILLLSSCDNRDSKELELRFKKQEYYLEFEKFKTYHALSQKSSRVKNSYYYVRRAYYSRKAIKYEKIAMKTLKEIAYKENTFDWLFERINQDLYNDHDLIVEKKYLLDIFKTLLNNEKFRHGFKKRDRKIHKIWDPIFKSKLTVFEYNRIVK